MDPHIIYGAMARFIYGAMARFASRSKIAGLRHPPLSLRPCAAASGSGPSRPPSQVIATKAAMGAADPAEPGALIDVVRGAKPLAGEERVRLEAAS